MIPMPYWVLAGIDTDRFWVVCIPALGRQLLISGAAEGAGSLHSADLATKQLWT
jgi:hypothetical protein